MSQTGFQHAPAQVPGSRYRPLPPPWAPANAMSCPARYSPRATSCGHPGRASRPRAPSPSSRAHRMPPAPERLQFVSSDTGQARAEVLGVFGHVLGVVVVELACSARYGCLAVPGDRARPRSARRPRSAFPSADRPDSGRPAPPLHQGLFQRTPESRLRWSPSQAGLTISGKPIRLAASCTFDATRQVQ